MDNAAATGMGLVIFAILIVPAIALFVAWIILPFAVVGTKPLLRELIAELKRSNALSERNIKAAEWVATNTEKLPPSLPSPPIQPR